MLRAQAFFLSRMCSGDANNGMRLLRVSFSVLHDFIMEVEKWLMDAIKFFRLLDKKEKLLRGRVSSKYTFTTNIF